MTGQIDVDLPIDVSLPVAGSCSILTLLLVHTAVGRTSGGAVFVGGG